MINALLLLWISGFNYDGNEIERQLKTFLRIVISDYVFVALVALHSITLIKFDKIPHAARWN